MHKAFGLHLANWQCDYSFYDVWLPINNFILWSLLPKLHSACLIKTIWDDIIKCTLQFLPQGPYSEWMIISFSSLDRMLVSHMKLCCPHYLSITSTSAHYMATTIHYFWKAYHYFIYIMIKVCAIKTLQWALVNHKLNKNILWIIFNMKVTYNSYLSIY